MTPEVAAAIHVGLADARRRAGAVGRGPAYLNFTEEPVDPRAVLPGRAYERPARRQGRGRPGRAVPRKPRDRGLIRPTVRHSRRNIVLSESERMSG